MKSTYSKLKNENKKKNKKVKNEDDKIEVINNPKRPTFIKD